MKFTKNIGPHWPAALIFLIPAQSLTVVMRHFAKFYKKTDPEEVTRINIAGSMALPAIFYSLCAARRR